MPYASRQVSTQEEEAEGKDRLVKEFGSEGKAGHALISETIWFLYRKEALR